MQNFKKNIDNQIEFNKGKNLFSDDALLTMDFIRKTVNSFGSLSDITQEDENLLINYTVDKVLDELCRINQYYYFNSNAKKELRNLYTGLFSKIKTSNESYEIISKEHYKKLKEWLRESNPFSEKLYSNNDMLYIEPVTCSEYNAELQIDILNIDIKNLMEPVLDIGCGKKGNLVKYLRNMNIEATGFDRFSFENNDFIGSDWLEYDYGISKWGTIISNLGFSNHFIHHHLRKDGDFIKYARKYMDILNSLKTGGTFYYAPGLPFIEQYLDENKFLIKTFNINNSSYNNTSIKRLG